MYSAMCQELCLLSVIVHLSNSIRLAYQTDRRTERQHSYSVITHETTLELRTQQLLKFRLKEEILASEQTV